MFGNGGDENTMNIPELLLSEIYGNGGDTRPNPSLSEYGMDEMIFNPHGTIPRADTAEYKALEEKYLARGKVLCHTIHDSPFDPSHIYVSMQSLATGKQKYWQTGKTHTISCSLFLRH